MMAWPTIGAGVILILIGVAGYANQEPNPETGKVSGTALIPAYIGGVLLLCGLLAFADKLRKHVMHLAAVVGLFGFLGGFMPLMRQYSKTGAIDVTKPAAMAGLAMSLVCLVFVGLCVNSFIQARRARRLREQAGVTG